MFQDSDPGQADWGFYAFVVALLQLLIELYGTGHP